MENKIFIFFIFCLYILLIYFIFLINYILYIFLFFFKKKYIKINKLITIYLNKDFYFTYEL